METNPVPRRPVPDVCRIRGINVRGLAGNLGDLTVASSQYHILFFLRHWSQLCVTCRSCQFPDSVALPFRAGARCLGFDREMAAYVRDGYEAFLQPKFECDCCEMLVFSVRGVK